MLSNVHLLYSTDILRPLNIIYDQTTYDIALFILIIAYATD
jgi:hypothetical protein